MLAAKADQRNFGGMMASGDTTPLWTPPRFCSRCGSAGRITHSSLGATT